MSDAATILLPPKLVPVFAGTAPVRGAYGGRGSAKTRTFAKMAALKAFEFASNGIEGQILCAREHLNSLDESSMEEVKMAIRSEKWLEAQFDIGEKFIRTRDRRVKFTFAGLRYNVDSLKSRARILLAWVDEAERVPEGSWLKLLPTLREEGEGWASELWVTWNPESEESATHKRFREKPPEDARIVEMNWRDNPWFPAVLDKQRLEDLDKRPDTYEHVWEGGFLTFHEGAYFAREMRAAENEGRICGIPIEPVIPTFTFWDLGISDDMAIIVMQPVGKELRIVSSYSNSGYGMTHYLQWLLDFQDKHGVRFGGGSARAPHFAPHDVTVRELTTGERRIDAAARLGISFEAVPRVTQKQDSIDALRRIFPRLWFNKQDEGVQRLCKALRQYHREWDDQRQTFRQKPQHDWSSNLSDAAQQLAMAWDDDFAAKKKPQLSGAVAPKGWMG